MRALNFESQKTEAKVGIAVINNNDKFWNARFIQGINQIKQRERRLRNLIHATMPVRMKDAPWIWLNSTLLRK